MGDTLLLADPNPTMQRVVELTCAEHGFTVVSVSDGQQALDYLVAERPALALISVTLPNLDGFEIAGLVRKRPDLQGIPVLLLAGAFETIDEARVRESGAAGVLVKPFEPGLVIKRVKELIGMSKLAGPPTSIPVPESSFGRMVTNLEASDRGAEEPATSAEPVPSDAALGQDTGGTWRELREWSDRGAHAAKVETAKGAEGYFSKLDAAFESSKPGAPDAPGASGAIDWRELQDEGTGSGLDGTYFVSEHHAISTHPDSASVAAPEVTRDAPATYGGIAAPTAGFAAAEAFAMLWAHEQGEPLPPVAPPPPLELSEQTVDAVVQRMTDQLTERVTDNLASRVTDGLAARLTTEVSARVAEGLAERIAAHVATRMMQEAFGDELRRTVYDVSERLVREEIARIRAAATDSLRS